MAFIGVTVKTYCRQHLRRLSLKQKKVNKVRKTQLYVTTFVLANGATAQVGWGMGHVLPDWVANGGLR